MSNQFTMQLTTSYIVRYRKAATKRLSRKHVLPSSPKAFRPKRIYLPLHTKAVHKAWKLAGMICAERLQPMLGEYLQSLHEANKLGLSCDDQELLTHIPLISLKRIIDAFDEKIYGVCDTIDNFFIPSAKLKRAVKNRQGKVIRRIHDKPQTPYMRLINDDHVSQTVKTKLDQIKAKLNLVLLVEEKEHLLAALSKTI